MTLQTFDAPTHDGHVLKGYLVHPEKSPGEAKRTRRMWHRLKKAGIEKSHQPRGTVILMHGRGGLKENMLTIAQRFVAADFRCIVYDARSHGESGGKYCTYGKLEKQDASSVLDHIDKILSSRGESIEPVVAFGNSLGAAVMLQAIPEDPRIIAGVAAAPFADMKEVVTHVIGNATSHRIPITWRSLFVDIACFRAGFRPEEVAPEQHAKEIAIPVFVAHGCLDEVIPINQARRIFRNLPEEKRKWQEIPDAYHYNILAEGGDDLYEAMIHFYLDAISLQNKVPGRLLNARYFTK
jgi:alpha-beta hydrolase superfamily lysophospholipase